MDAALGGVGGIPKKTPRNYSYLPRTRYRDTHWSRLLMIWPDIIQLGHITSDKFRDRGVLNGCLASSLVSFFFFLLLPVPISPPKIFNTREGREQRGIEVVLLL